MGFKFTVGGSPITVSSLGRWVLSGNTASHVMTVVQASSSTVVATGTVNTSGAPTGTFTYASLSTPVILSANTAYYVLSQEATGGDEFYQDNTALTTTSAGTINNSEYYSGGAYRVGNSTGSYSYGPVSFIYSQ